MVSSLDIARQRMSGLGLWDRVDTSPRGVVGRLLAMQAQEHAYARWSIAQRVSGSASASDVDRAFDAGEVLRTHVLRPTWHYVSPQDLRWLMKLSGPRVNAWISRRSRDLGLDGGTLARALDVIADAVASGPRTRRELSEELEEHGISTAEQRLAYIVMHAELERIVCSGPMRGRQHTYADFDDRVPRAQGLEGDDALAELARRYFTTRGPATTTDLGWWAGLRAADARRAIDLARKDLETFETDGRTYWWAGDELKTPALPRIDLVQCYDEAIISYSQSRDVLKTSDVDFAAPQRIDGFAHVVLLDGRLLGHWRVVTSRGDVRVETRIGVALGAKEQQALDAALARYRTFIAS